MARMAAVRRTQQDLSGIRAAVESDDRGEFDSLISCLSFHRAIAAASKNRMLSLFMTSVHMTIRNLAERYILPEAKQVSQGQHRLIYEAVAGGDEALARSRMREHLRSAREVYREAVPKEDADRAPKEHRADGSGQAGVMTAQR